MKPIVIINSALRRRRLMEMRLHLGNSWGISTVTFEATVHSNKKHAIAETYDALARQAVDEGWDSDQIVMQDDVRFKAKPVIYDLPLVVYGFERESGHVCPQAFAASRETWEKRLWYAFDGHAQVCKAWLPTVKEVGIVLNTARETAVRLDIDAVQARPGEIEHSQHPSRPVPLHHDRVPSERGVGGKLLGE